MGSVLPTYVSYTALGPVELRIAAAAFEAARRSLRARVGARDAHARQEILAEYIMQRVLIGERDVKRLRDGALGQGAIEAYTAVCGRR